MPLSIAYLNFSIRNKRHCYYAWMSYYKTKPNILQIWKEELKLP